MNGKKWKMPDRDLKSLGFERIYDVTRYAVKIESEDADFGLRESFWLNTERVTFIREG